MSEWIKCSFDIREHEIYNMFLRVIPSITNTALEHIQLSIQQELYKRETSEVIE